VERSTRQSSGRIYHAIAALSMLNSSRVSFRNPCAIRSERHDRRLMNFS